VIGWLGVLIVGVFGWAALRPDPQSAFDTYLLRMAFLCGVLGIGAAAALHRYAGWRLSVPRMLALAGLAAAILGPLGALLLGFEDPVTRNAFEWLQMGLLSGLGFAMVVYGWRGRR